MTALWLLPVAGFVLVGWLLGRDAERWANYRDPWTRTRDEIRGLPEVSEWERAA